MPKFVSGSSGHIYSHGTKDDEEDEISKFTNDHQQRSCSVKKPSAVNKKGAKELQKSSLDLFKEELRRLNAERDEQRNKLKKSINEPGDHVSADEHTATTTQQQTKSSQQHQAPICIPLKPDPRCPTTLTLQVNLNPKDKDASTSGSFDTGDPTTTNVYLGNLNPTVNENDLCDIFGKFGPLASIKVMWPRTDEERARNRNSGFVAYMSRIDAERALRTLNGMDIRGYDVKLGWGKAVPLPQKPVFIPPELVKLLEPPPHTGLPFNGQLHEMDLRRKYKVPSPQPKPLPAELLAQLGTNPEVKNLKESYDEFMEVYNRSTVRVVIPQDRELLDRIHKTIEFVVREGPVLEAIIMAREQGNANYKFLHNNYCYEHVYYRWKLYSVLHGDDPYKWRTEEFRMFEGGPIWKPPPLNPFADGMPVELIEKSTGVNRELLLNDSSSVIHGGGLLNKPHLDIKSTVRLHLNLSDTRQKGSLGTVKRPQLQTILERLVPTKTSIGTAMMFCINHSDAALEVIDCIFESNRRPNLALANKIAHVFLISDVLHNCSAAVTNASFYRKGFQAKLVSIFEDLRSYLVHMESMHDDNTRAQHSQKSDNFKHKILSVLGAWREWTLYEDEFIIKLSDILLGLDNSESNKIKPAIGADTLPSEQTRTKLDDSSRVVIRREQAEENLDGDQLDEETLIKCLEIKGLSLRWYKTLGLSDDEDEATQSDTNSNGEDKIKDSKLKDKRDRCSVPARDSSSTSVKFKVSKWETVDPNEVAEQVVRLSKWEAIERAAQEAAAASGSSTSFEGEEDFEESRVGAKRAQKLGRYDESQHLGLGKRLKRHERSPSTSSSSP